MLWLELSWAVAVTTQKSVRPSGTSPVVFWVYQVPLESVMVVSREARSKMSTSPKDTCAVSHEDIRCMGRAYKRSLVGIGGIRCRLGSSAHRDQDALLTNPRYIGQTTPDARKILQGRSRYICRRLLIGIDHDQPIHVLKQSIPLFQLIRCPVINIPVQPKRQSLLRRLRICASRRSVRRMQAHIVLAPFVTCRIVGP